ncbi:deoxyribodipyrimidine photo-lyase [Vibrio sp. MA40-2]|uniref:deoxyribodipyrimidine photo-lyase n=1 Tax=Vibrio sp. MA40-2 TaxID=3391828 RepID=UPI0039A5A320
MTALVWFRRDLRVHDNPALQEAIQLGATKALYISTPKQWKKHNVAPIQVDLIRRHLGLIDQQLSELGIQLYHLQATDFDNQNQLLTDFCHEHNIEVVCANREPEINEINRDKAFATSDIELKLHRSDTILPVGSVLNKQGLMFKVFTPFKKTWFKQLQLSGVECIPTPLMDKSPSLEVDVAAEFEANSLEVAPFKVNNFKVNNFDIDYPIVDSSQWPLSDVVMGSVVSTFFQTKLNNYHQNRDFPFIKGTSGLSPYLAIGAISPRWLITQLLQHEPELIDDVSVAGFAWLNELIWRDFYKHLLFHYPDLVKGTSFQAKYQNMMWPGNPQHFAAWCEGRTGYPIVDAAMKQLVKTGWMHNRLRMIVASFLTKHLLIDWRLGEQFFMSKLIDGDFSANNGGWQWSASTGCDAQPYFRIFNPITQSQRFDAKGDFIRKYLPELANVPDKYIHFPHDYLKLSGKADEYCGPIVDHKEARLKALELFKPYQ